MDSSATFARLFARLVWLLLREPANVDEQKVTLRALVTTSRSGAVRLEMRQGTIAANDNAMPPALPGVAELRERMTALGVRAIEVDGPAVAADLLGAARRLADVPGAAVGVSVRFIGATPVTPAVTVRESEDAPVQPPVVEAAVPAREPEIEAAPAPEPEADAEPTSQPGSDTDSVPFVLPPPAAKNGVLPRADGLFEHFAVNRPA